MSKVKGQLLGVRMALLVDPKQHWAQWITLQGMQQRCACSSLLLGCSHPVHALLGWLEGGPVQLGQGHTCKQYGYEDETSHDVMY